MSDPFLSGADAAINALNKGIELGKKAESFSQNAGNFINAGAARNLAARRAAQQKFGTVTDDVIKLYMHKKKVEAMEKDLKASIISQYGPNAWNEVLKLQEEVKKKRADDMEKYRQDKLKSKIVAIVAFCILPLTIFVTYAIFKLNH